MMRMDAHVFTALPIAASRAIANGRPDAMIHDPLAQKLLQGHEHLLQHASSSQYRIHDPKVLDW